jgi:uncharacterized protein YfdQ (DUF2303 family)
MSVTPETLNLAATESEPLAIAALTAAGLDVKTVSDSADDQQFVLLPPGYKLESLERLTSYPLRSRGNTTARSADAFVELVKQLCTDQSRLYGQLFDRNNKAAPKFLAVVNDHQLVSAGWRDHTITYNCPLSTEWATWIGSNKREMSQPTFAQFVEDNAPDIIDPLPAEMLEVARTLESRKGVNFKSGVRLSNGEVQFAYEESIESKAGEKGQLKVPEVFTIGIPVFEGARQKNAIKARLRYRIADKGSLTLWYDLERPHKDLEAAMADLWADIAAATGRTIINGEPS